MNQIDKLSELFTSELQRQKAAFAEVDRNYVEVRRVTEAMQQEISVLRFQVNSLKQEVSNLSMRILMGAI